VGWLTDPRIGERLLRDEGEVIVDEVTHHWVVYILPVLELIGALALLCATPFVPLGIGWLPMLLALGVALHALWGGLTEHMDRFVVTNMRVFRVKGVLSQQVATMPLSRILDITVQKPLHGRIFGFGHFTFESAAQEQGLRDIRYVARPDQRDLAIQRVVARAGLRPSVN
jgi:hypothetical protein